MKNIKLWDLLFRWVAPVVVLGLSVWFFIAMGVREKTKRKKAPPKKSTPVQWVKMIPHSGPLDIEVNGNAIPYREVDLSAQVGGEITKKSERLSPGRFVTQGDSLLEIDATDYQLEVARLEQEVKLAQIDLAQLELDRVNADRLLELNRNVVRLRQADVSRLERLQGAASVTELNALKLAQLAASEKVIAGENLVRSYDTKQKELDATLKLANLQLKRARLDLERTRITAPFSGVVVETFVEANSTVAKGQLIARLEDTSKVEVRCNLRSQDLALLAHFQPPASQPPTAPRPSSTAYELPPVPVTIQLERAGKLHQWAGVLSRQDGLGLEQNTRTMPVRVRVDRPTQNLGSTEQPHASIALIRGMFVKVVLHWQPDQSLMTLPESVIRPGKNVWLMRDGKLRVEPIHVSRIDNGQAYFDPANSNIRTDDKVISSPVPDAREGLAVSEKRQGGKKANAKGNASGNAKKNGQAGKTKADLTSTQSLTKQASTEGGGP